MEDKMNIKFVKGDAVKVTHEKFKKALEADGWKVADEKKPKKKAR
jgi:hypothetical protein